MLVRTDPLAAIEVARVAVGHARRTGNPGFLGTALGNGAIALLAIGDWDQAEMELAEALDVDGLDNDDIRSIRALLTALRGDGAAAADLARLPTFRSSEVIQDRVVIAMVEAFIAEAAGETEAILRHACLVLEHTDTMRDRE